MAAIDYGSKHRVNYVVVEWAKKDIYISILVGRILTNIYFFSLLIK